MPSSDHPPLRYPARLPYRSYLYVSPSTPDVVREADRSPADAVVLDLEDLTPEAGKDQARAVAAEFLSGTPERPTLVRVNAARDDGTLERDLAAVVAPGLTAIRLPKSEDAARIRWIAGLVEDLRARRNLAGTIGLQVMAETARGVESLAALATATHTVWSVGLGEGDLRAELGTATDEGLAYARTRLVYAAAAAHLPPPVQVAFPPGGDEADLRRSTELGRSLGFGGRSILNPAHAATVHAIYPLPAAADPVAGGSVGGAGDDAHAAAAAGADGVRASFAEVVA
ncbi:HpcH/HpaI aldolase/citrate lyase family protein [Acrocarpospora catenulata]|uniref:HpcH/HpaI aldolase/citrate lyase family protein n=1 Tax=Acrocarpospora catenulata TaxID=2836182 RepID=UPI001BDA1614|nr:aldolase/citrate lyase family protein [Acrocarpospora catenulata]